MGELMKLVEKHLHHILMWSHYADQHKGFVLQFDIVHDVRNFLPIIKVNYSNKYPLINWSKLTPAVTAIALKRKHKEWEYEKEWRIINTSGARTYFKFKPEVIIGLTFGCRASERFKNKIFKILQTRKATNLNPIDISCAVKHDREFKLNLEKDQSLNWPI